MPCFFRYTIPNKLPAKQVSILARRKTRIDREKNLAVLREKTRVAILRKKPRNFKKAESFVMEYLQAERDQNRIKRHLLKKTEFAAPLPENKKLLLIMRHRTKAVASPQVNKIFRELRLFKIHTAVLVVADARVAAYLPIMEPYITYGTPNISLVRDLVFKYGKIVVDGKPTAINSNVLVEKALGEHGIICVEDIIHTLIKCEENFEAVSKILLPFVLKSPRDGWKKKLNKGFKVGGEFGDRGNAINELIPLCM